MKRKPESPATGAVFIEEFIKLIAAFGQSVDPLRLLAGSDVERKNADAFGFGELVAVNLIRPPDAFHALVEFLQLTESNCSLKVG